MLHWEQNPIVVASFAMVALAPIAPFLTLIDTLIALIKARQTRHREYFEKIIDPLYTQFKPLGEDNLRLFREARDIVLARKKVSPKSATATIRKRREEFLSARQQLNGLLEACEKDSARKKDEDVTQFIRAMLQFFRPTGERGIPSMGRQLLDFFEGAEGFGRRPMSPEFFINDATARLERSWYEIAGRYMQLKLKYLAE